MSKALSFSPFSLGPEKVLYNVPARDGGSLENPENPERPEAPVPVRAESPGDSKSLGLLLKVGLLGVEPFGCEDEVFRKLELWGGLKSLPSIMPARFINSSTTRI